MEQNPPVLPSLIGLSRDEFAQILKDAGQPAFRAKQLWQWVYNRGAKDFSEMSNLAKELRQYLSEHYTLARPGISRAHTSFDDTRKWLLRFDDAKEAEMVYIPEDDRGALCVSSQVGCTLTCSFCHTGTMPLVRNLTAGEIVGQFMLARDELDDWQLPVTGNRKRGKQAEPALSVSGANSPCEQQDVAQRGDNRKLTTIVMMGMGEPLFNYDNVAKALTILMDAEGLGLSKRRITLSTSGVVPQIEQCGRELGVNLAISLHAVTDELRNELVPLNKKWPIAALLQACRDYPTASNARRITFEYVMLKGINDSDADAHALVKLVEGIPAKINLIPFNPWPGSNYECSSNNRIRAFAEIVNAAGFSSPIRTPRGRDILAACGQLKSDSERKRGEKAQL